MKKHNKNNFALELKYLDKTMKTNCLTSCLGPEIIIIAGFLKDISSIQKLSDSAPTIVGNHRSGLPRNVVGLDC